VEILSVIPRKCHTYQPGLPSFCLLEGVNLVKIHFHRLDAPFNMAKTEIIMSDYQYYEFCQIGKPLSQEARREMASLSSRAHVGTHSASYVYNYGNFRGNPKELLLKYFDVFFYISKYGTVQLMFKYENHEVDVDKLKKFSIKYVISCEQHGHTVLLDVCLTNEEDFGWTEGEGLLPDFLPLYDEIKTKNYQFLKIATAINSEFSGKNENTFGSEISNFELSPAQEAFISITGVACQR
jgi:hypothetical protein